MLTANTPLSVHRYLNTLPRMERLFAFCQLDQGNFLVSSGGDVNKFCIAHLHSATPIHEQLDFLGGYLPFSNEVLVVPSIQYVKHRYLDLHTYTASGWQWVVLIEKTITAHRHQALQQIRLLSQLKSQSLTVSVLQSSLQ